MIFFFLILLPCASKGGPDFLYHLPFLAGIYHKVKENGPPYLDLTPHLHVICEAFFVPQVQTKTTPPPGTPLRLFVCALESKSIINENCVTSKKYILSIRRILLDVKARTVFNETKFNDSVCNK